MHINYQHAIGRDAAAWTAGIGQFRWYKQLASATFFEKWNAHGPSLNELAEITIDTSLTAKVEDLSASDQFQSET